VSTEQQSTEQQKAIGSTRRSITLNNDEYTHQKHSTEA